MRAYDVGSPQDVPVAIEGFDEHPCRKAIAHEAGFEAGSRAPNCFREPPLLLQSPIDAILAHLRCAVPAHVRCARPLAAPGESVDGGFGIRGADPGAFESTVAANHGFVGTVHCVPLHVPVARLLRHVLAAAPANQAVAVGEKSH